VTNKTPKKGAILGLFASVGFFVMMCIDAYSITNSRVWCNSVLAGAKVLSQATTTTTTTTAAQCTYTPYIATTIVDAFSSVFWVKYSASVMF